MTPIPFRLFGLAIALGAALAPSGRAQVLSDDLPVVRLDLVPARPPAAAFEYRLLPRYPEQVPGNAAPRYYRAVLALKAAAAGESQAKASQLLDRPLEEMPLDEARKVLERFHRALEETHAGALHETCDWGIPVRGDPDIYSTVIEEIQEARTLAWLLSLEARVHMLEGNFDAAVRSLQTGYALGRHVAEMPFIISGLVGLAIANITSERVQEMSTVPGSPNLYWALTALPEPLVDLRKAMELEMSVAEQMFPFLKDAETSRRTPAEWQAAFDEAARKLQELQGNGSGDRSTRLAMTALALTVYPQAKRYLLEHGYTDEQVEAMPVAQVIAIQIAQDYRQQRDELFKWFYVPYRQSQAEFARAESRLQADRSASPLSSLVSLLFPAISAAQQAEARTDRRIAELRVIEAIRLYAANHGGQLPRELSDIESVPVPPDPLTAQPFPYGAKDGKAKLIVSPLPADVPQRGRRYELTIRGSANQK